MRIKDCRKSHFFWAHDAIFDIWGSILKANGLAVYLCLVRHADGNGICYPSFGTIAKKCGVSRSTVVRTINKLIELGLIKREQRVVEREQSKGKEKTSNLYTILDLPTAPSVRETQPQCQKDTTPSVTQTLPQCHTDTTPSVTQTPKGIHIQKEYTKKEYTIKGKKTHTNTGYEKNSRKESVFFPLNDFEKAAWDWAQAHEFWKDRITTVERLRKNLDTGKDFRRQFDKVNTPVQPSHFSPPTSTTNGNGRIVFTISECPFCDENGEFRYRDKNGKVLKALCKHWNDTPDVGTKRGFEFIPPPNSAAIINSTSTEQKP